MIENLIPKALSGNEAIKRNSKYLKGNIAEELANDKPDVSDEAYELLKFHGTYFGHNRDTATERKKHGLDKEYEFMVRTRIPGGRLSAEQYLAMDDIAGKYANGTLRITTRQVFQLHVVLKENLKANIAAINHALLSTQSGCGDVTRNITCSPAPYSNAKYRRLREDVDRVAEFVRPRTSAYKEIWLDEEADEVREKAVVSNLCLVTSGKEKIQVASHKPQATDYEPLYGPTYMPRKFKIGLILPEDNSIDVFTHDLGVVLIFDGDKLRGYNLLLGGGMGMKHEATKTWAEKKTYPRLADPVAFIGHDDLLKAVEAVIKLQRDYGDRSDRQHARLKYVVQERGLDWTRKTLQEYFIAAGGGKLQNPVPVAKYDIPEHMGWHDQGDDKVFLGVPVPSGRIVDYDRPHPSGYNPGRSAVFAKAKYRTGLRAFVEKYKPDVVLTPKEEIIFYNIDPKNKVEIEKLLRGYGIPLVEDFKPTQLHYMTCVALPTCAKALAESERVQFDVYDDIQKHMDKNGIGKEKMTIRIAGCPNGCSRPYIGDIGIVGRMPGHYVIFIGGDFEGTRLNTKVFDKVPQEQIGIALNPLFARYASGKQAGEGFGDFCNRYGIEKIANEARVELREYKWAIV